MLIDDLMRHSQSDGEAPKEQLDLFADFNGLPSEEAKTEFLPARRQLVEPHDSRRQLAGDGIPDGA